MSDIATIQESDLEFAISENGAEIVIQGQKYPCVASSHDETRDQGDDGFGLKMGYSLNVTMLRRTFKGRPLQVGREVVMVIRNGTTRKYRVQTYGESSSGHAILISLDAERS